MWSFMYLCYLMTAITALLLFLTGLQGLLQFSIFQVGHPAFAIFTLIIYLFTQTIIIFFFVGNGMTIKEHIAKDATSDKNLYQRALTIKKKIYPPVMLNILLVSCVFITGGAVDTNRFPGWLHGLLFLAAFIHFIKIISVEHASFRESTKIFLELSGLKLGEP
ncbi:MAG: hypothetical protein WC676_05595 [Candidatus Omnitrophota bacterium]